MKKMVRPPPDVRTGRSHYFVEFSVRVRDKRRSSFLAGLWFLVYRLRPTPKARRDAHREDSWGGGLARRKRLTVGEPIGNAMTKIKLAPNYRVQYIVKSSLAAITPGSFVGAAALQGPNGTLRAIEVHYFAPGFKGRAFSAPLELGPTSQMTNGTRREHRHDQGRQRRCASVDDQDRQRR